MDMQFPIHITTKSDNLRVHFVSDSTVGQAGFNLTYEVQIGKLSTA